MCGIVGAIAKKNIVQTLIEGLKRLEYRGYDSAGFAVIGDDEKIQQLKRTGKVKTLENAQKKNKLNGHIGIAHTRWATHGKPSEKNAHPHQSAHLSIVHNGIIENHLILKEELLGHGYTFVSGTDSEVIAHLIHHEQKTQPDLLLALQSCIDRLRGAFAIVLLDENNPNQLYTARSGSPIVLGIGEEANYISSDHFAIQDQCSSFIFLEEGDIAIVGRRDYKIFDIQGQFTQRDIHHYTPEDNDGDLGDFQHFMQKEIFFQPQAQQHLLKGTLLKSSIDLGAISNLDVNVLKKTRHIQFIACGTSYHAALIGKNWLESIAKVSSDVDIASEFRYRDTVIRPDTLFITLSQSGETADTLAALRKANKEKYLSTITICNVPNASLVRESEFAIMTKAGIEIGVASTKAFTAQLTTLFLLTCVCGKIKNHITADKYQEYLDALKQLPTDMTAMLATESAIQQVAKVIAKREHAFYLGRGEFYPLALEGALKLKEISYIFTQAYAAGELKHGPLALIDKNIPVVVLAPNNKLLPKIKSNIEEVKARGGKIIVFTDEPAEFIDETVIALPKTQGVLSAILFSIPLQLLAYHTALEKKTDVDQPRNLAKAVTVE